MKKSVNIIAQCLIYITYYFSMQNITTEMSSRCVVYFVVAVELIVVLVVFPVIENSSLAQ